MLENNNIVKGFKVFNSDWTCRNFQYEVGKTYKHDGNIKLCGSGFHFCINIIDCFYYYNFNSSNKVAEVEAIGLVETGDNKSVTNKIKIVRELSWLEVLNLVNTGKDCTGYQNSGNNNSGNYNSGVYNSGDYNSGYYNSGNNNSGDYNSGDYSSGVFCTKEPKIKIFDVQSNMTLSEWKDTKASQILNLNFKLNLWISVENMTIEEKKEYSSYKTTGGYVKKLSYKEAWYNMWSNLTFEEKEIIKNIPNFDEKKFKEITGINI